MRLYSKPLVFSFLLCVITSCVHHSPYSQAASNSINKYREVDRELLLSHLAYLSSDKLAGRAIGTPGNKLAQNYIITELKKHQLQPFFDKSYHQTFSYKRSFSAFQGTNIVAVVNGTKYSDEFMVLTAHYDHIGKKGRHIFNGADDNASGAAALLMFAKEIQKKPLPINVIFLFTDGEEHNLNGAKAFINAQQSNITKFKLNINLDMLAGNSKTNTLHFISSRLTQVFGENTLDNFNNLQKNGNVRIKKGFNQYNKFAGYKKTRWRLASDHAVFYQHKIPFIYYGVGEHNNYHKPTDTYDNVNHLFYWQACNDIYRQIRFLANNYNS